MNRREPMRKPNVTLVTERGQSVSPDTKEVTLLATSELAALLDTLAAVRMDLSRIAESKSMPESAKVERLRFAIVAIDAVTVEVKKTGGLDFIANAAAR